jgi:hypothetical protein
MYSKEPNAETQDDIESLSPIYAEDPRREPHEKETSLNVTGEGARFVITSFKRVVYEKLVQHPEFALEHVHVRGTDGQEKRLESLSKAIEQQLKIIGVDGEIPVGAISIGSCRNDNTHSDIVK